MTLLPRRRLPKRYVQGADAELPAVRLAYVNTDTLSSETAMPQLIVFKYAGSTTGGRSFDFKAPRFLAYGHLQMLKNRVNFQANRVYTG